MTPATPDDKRPARLATEDEKVTGRKYIVTTRELSAVERTVETINAAQNSAVDAIKRT
jgi:hypothetical protein